MSALQIHKPLKLIKKNFTYHISKVPAGFLSPAADYTEGKLDLNEYLIKNTLASFYVRASGDSMINAGIYPNSLLLVDRSITPVDGKIIIVILHGELTIKRLRKTSTSISLLS